MMSVAGGGVGGSRVELRCVLHWFSLWDAQQKEAFSHTLLAHLAPPDPATEDDFDGELCGQLGGLSLSCHPPVLRCQLSLCEAYFSSWGPRGVWELVDLLAHRDGDFVGRLLASLAQRSAAEDPFLAQPPLYPDPAAATAATPLEEEALEQ